MSGRSALITGRSAWIGLAIARAVVQDGWNVTIAARDQGKLDDAVASLRTGAGTVHAAAVSLAADAAETLLGQHLDTHGGLDLLVNKARVGLEGPMEKKTAKALALEIALNLRSAYRMMQVAIPALRRSAAAARVTW